MSMGIHLRKKNEIIIEHSESNFVYRVELRKMHIKALIAFAAFLLVTALAPVVIQLFEATMRHLWDNFNTISGQFWNSFDTTLHICRNISVPSQFCLWPSPPSAPVIRRTGWAGKDFFLWKIELVIRDWFVLRSMQLQTGRRAVHSKSTTLGDYRTSHKAIACIHSLNLR